MKPNDSKKLSFVCFGGVDWWYHNRAHIDLQLMRRFADDGIVLYINSIVMQKPNLSRGKKFIKKLLRKTKSILTGLKKVEADFWVYSPLTLPVHHIAWLRPLNELVLRFQVRRVSRKLGIYKPLVLIACPGACDTATKLEKSKLIYQRTDRFEEAEEMDVETIKRYDRILKADADITYYVNKQLYAEEADQCKKAIYLGHGVDFELFASAEQDVNVPQDMADIPKPIIGYFGEINGHCVDIELAEKVAHLLSEMSFVYVGAVSSDCLALSARKNVWMLGQKDYYEIPQYGKCFDVSTLPWIRNRWTEAANPIKIKEYLALGKPFVTTDVCTEIQQYLDVAYVGNTAVEFAECIIRALDENSPKRIAARRRKVEKDTWDSKAKLLLLEVFRQT